MADKRLQIQANILQVLLHISAADKTDQLSGQLGICKVLYKYYYYHQAGEEVSWIYHLGKITDLKRQCGKALRAVKFFQVPSPSLTDDAK